MSKLWDRYWRATQVEFGCVPLRADNVLAGQALMMLEHNYEASDDLLRSMPIGLFRSDAEGVAFRMRLLVEIAARVLSPPVNDFYSALAAADSLGRVLRAQSGRWINEDKVAALVDHPAFEVIGQDRAALFTHPLSSLRQAAASYPSVAIRLIETCAQVAATAAAEPGFASYLRRQAAELADHVAVTAGYDGDRRAIRAAYEAAFAAVFTSASPLAR